MGFFDIEELITPKVIKILWIIGIIAAIIWLLIGFIGSLIAGNFLIAIVFLIAIPIGLLFYRLYLEFIIVIFKIEKNIRK